MKDLFTVMKFTMKDMIKRRSFIISTIIFLVMIDIGFNVPKILKSMLNYYKKLPKMLWTIGSNAIKKLGSYLLNI